MGGESVLTGDVDVILFLRDAGHKGTERRLHTKILRHTCLADWGGVNSDSGVKECLRLLSHSRELKACTGLGVTN